MSDRDEMLGELRRVVDALGSYRDDVVLAGGFVPLVYRQSAPFEPPPHGALLSGDIDLTVPENLAVRERRLKDCLEDADFVVVLSRSTEPPIHYYQRREHGESSLARYHVEFLAPLKGKSTNRDGSPKSPKAIQDGVNAQLLRYMDLLLHDPLEVAPFGDALAFRVPNPAAYVVQKLLASARRSSHDKRDKDLAYIYDVALLTRSDWGSVASRVDSLRDAFPTKWFDDASDLARGHFDGPDSVGPLAIARVLKDHDPATAPTSEGAQRVVRRFFRAIRLFE